LDVPGAGWKLERVWIKGGRKKKLMKVTYICREIKVFYFDFILLLYFIEFFIGFLGVS
jgi:hypothetical protein